MLGVPDMSFPRLNNISIWLLIPSIFILLIGPIADSGAGTGIQSDMIFITSSE